MKPKLHINTLSSRGNEGSHFQISKLLNFQILSLLFLLSSFFSNAQQTQPYEWDWAIKGGGSLGGSGSAIDDERIYDVKVGTDSNYYFITSIAGPSNANLDGYSVPVYNTSNTIAGGTKDIFLFSTDCEGQVRWSQTIGGWQDDTAYNLVLDEENNVYVGVNVRNEDSGSGGGIRPPLHFSEDDTIPFPNYSNGGVNIPQEGFKTTYLVKYDSNGNYLERKALQGAVTGINFTSQISDLAIDSQGKIHFIIGLMNGTHLDGNVTVPPSFYTLYNYQYHVVTYDTYPNFEYNSSILLDLTGAFFNSAVRFIYDENSHQYYIAGMTSLGVTGVTYPFSFDGNPIVNRSFILAFDDNDGSENWRREVYSTSTSGQANVNCIFSLVSDTDSSVYVGGSFHQNNGLNIKIYDPTDISFNPHFVTAGVTSTIPMIIKFNNDGDVQWAQATAAYSAGVLGPAPRYGKGIAINNNEVALGVQGGGDFWDNIEIVRPITNYQPDPVLVRFDKQTGNVLGVHDIEGEAISSKRMTAVATDSDGNYIVGGSFNANLFMNNNLGITPLISTGESDFFVAKLANSLCGSGNVSTNKFNKLTVNVYPNPTTDIVTIETDENLFNYSVYDINGLEIQTGIFGSTNQINLQSASNGVYFVKVSTTQGSSATVKVVKQ